MRKILHIITILVNIVLFISVYFAYIEKDVSDIYNYFGLAEGRKSTILEFDASINQESETTFFSNLQSISDRNHVDFVFSNMDYEKNSYEIYIFSNSDVSETMKLETNQKLSFRNGDKDVYDNNTNLYLLNPDVKVILAPLSMMSDNYLLNKPYMIIAEDDQHLNQAIYELSNLYPNQFVRMDGYISDSFNLQNEIADAFRLLFTVSIFSYLMIICYLISNEQKKIAILKLNGVSSFKCSIHLFAKQLLIDISLALFTLCGLFLWFIRVINSKTVLLIVQLFKGFAIQVGLFLIVIIISMILIRFQKLSSLIKGKNYNYLLMNFNYLIKLLLLVLLVPLNLTYLSKSIQNYQVVHYLQTNKKYYEDMLSLYYYKPTVEGIKYDPSWFFTDPDNQTLKLYSDIFDSLDNNGAILCNPKLIEISKNNKYLGIEVNQNYLQHFNILDSNSNTIKLDTSEDIVYILADETHYEDVKNNIDLFYQFQSEVQIIEVPSQSFVHFSLNYITENLPKTLIVYSNQALRFNKSFLNNVYMYDTSEADIDKILESYDLNGKIEFQRIVENADELYKTEIKQFVLNILVFVSLELLFLFQILQFIYFYYHSYKQRITVKKLLGYSKKKIFIPILGESLVAYIIPLVLSYKTNFLMMLIFILTTIILESGCCFVYDWIFMKKEIYRRSVYENC